MQRVTVMAALTAAMVVLASYGGSSDEGAGEISATPKTGAEGSTASLAEHLDAIDAAVAARGDAFCVEDSHTAAEAAANLILGPNGPDTATAMAKA